MQSKNTWTSKVVFQDEGDDTEEEGKNYEDHDITPTDDATPKDDPKEEEKGGDSATPDFSATANFDFENGGNTVDSEDVGLYDKKRDQEVAMAQKAEQKSLLPL